MPSDLILRLLHRLYRYSAVLATPPAETDVGQENNRSNRAMPKYFEIS